MFKSDFKYFKRRCSPLDLSGVLDFNQQFESKHEITERSKSTCDFILSENDLGLKPLDEWRIYEVPNKSGLLFITNPFTATGQRYWVCRCLRDFTCKPQKLNIDAHGDLKEGEKWWETCMKDKERGKTLIQKLRWATLGYHHNWDTKVYNEDSRDPFPDDLAILCHYVAKVIGFENFSAEAAIVNYYHMDSTLSGHTDHSEVNKEAPLFSFSFGQSAVFLLGGPTVEEKPTAMFIHSGDIVVMSGASRLCYHGIPRILSTDKTPWNISFPQDLRMCHNQRKSSDTSLYNVKDSVNEALNNAETRSKTASSCFNIEVSESCTKDYFWKPYENYLKTSRININVRQVLQPGQKTLAQQH